MTTYTNATLALPDGQRVKLDSFTWSHAERWSATVEPPRPFGGEIRFDLEASAGEVAELAAMLKRMSGHRICWKCYDGRTRAHNRRCRYRGHGHNIQVTR